MLWEFVKRVGVPFFVWLFEEESGLCWMCFDLFTVSICIYMTTFVPISDPTWSHPPSLWVAVPQSFFLFISCYSSFLISIQSVRSARCVSPMLSSLPLFAFASLSDAIRIPLWPRPGAHSLCSSIITPRCAVGYSVYCEYRNSTSADTRPRRQGVCSLPFCFLLFCALDSFCSWLVEGAPDRSTANMLSSQWFLSFRFQWSWSIDLCAFIANVSVCFSDPEVSCLFYVIHPRAAHSPLCRVSVFRVTVLIVPSAL